jgi:MOSC domain-containing protein YiiM
MIDVVAVNVATPRVLSDHKGQRVYSAIAKQPLPLGATLWLSYGNLAGDAQADLDAHGGPDKAVYAYPSEHLAAWTSELDGPLGDAPFGENLSTRGVVEHEVNIGDIWQWDDATLQVCQRRWPCFKLALHRSRADIQGRMRATGRTGWYLRVLEPGEVKVGSSIEVVQRDSAGLSVADAHHAMGDRHLAQRAQADALAHHPYLARNWRTPLLERLGDA